MKRETVSIRVDPKLWKEFRKHAIDIDKNVGDLIESLIKKELSGK